MICIGIVGLQALLLTLDDLDQSTGLQVGARIAVGTHFQTGEIIAEVEPDIGRTASGQRISGFPNVVVWRSPDLDGQDSTFYFELEAKVINGQDWFGVRRVEPDSLDKFVCID